MFADPQTGEWTWSEDGGWSGGFWPGMLWLAGAATGERRFADLASESAQRLRSRADAPTVLRGFLFWYGAGIASVLAPARRAQAELAITAARSLAADVDPAAGVLPPGEEDAEMYRWPRPGACIDGMPGTVPLLAFAAAATGEDRLRGIALAHARGLAAFCVRADGSVAQSATYDGQGRLIGQATIEGSSRDSNLGSRAGLGDARTRPGRPSGGRRIYRHGGACRRLVPRPHSRRHRFLLGLR
jgi:unsaturated chondroitin disaccharide hydrolase